MRKVKNVKHDNQKLKKSMPLLFLEIVMPIAYQRMSFPVHLRREKITLWDDRERGGATASAKQKQGNT